MTGTAQISTSLTFACAALVGGGRGVQEARARFSGVTATQRDRFTSIRT
jgi:hypothetical protein